LVESEFIEIDGVEPALGGGASGEEERIDIGELAAGVEDNRTDDGPRDDIGIVDEDEVEVQLVQQWNPLLQGGYLSNEGREHIDQAQSARRMPKGHRGRI
jgi:hypothetical protein